MKDPDLESISRDARRRRRLPADAKCAGCGGTSHLSMAPDASIRCYACTRAVGGALPFEEDHVAGRRNVGGVIVRLRPNDHREVTEMRIRLGIDEWPDAAGDPLRQLGHFLAGLGTLLLLLGRWLMQIADHVAGMLGQSWWTLAPELPVAP